MPITTKMFGLGVLFIVNNDVDWVADAISQSFHTATYTPNQDTDDFFNDATNELAAGSGYTAGGVALASKTATYDSASDQVRLDAADSTHSFTASKTWRHAIFRKARGGAATADEVIGYMSWDADQTVSTTYTLQYDPAGIFFFDAT